MQWKIDFISTTESTSRSSFIIVTVHCIDPSSLERFSVVLSCKQLKGCHTFDVLVCALNEIHTEYEIQNKIVKQSLIITQISVGHFSCLESNMKISTLLQLAEEGAFCDEEDENVDCVEVDLVKVKAVLLEDDGSNFQLPKHRPCA